MEKRNIFLSKWTSFRQNEDDFKLFLKSLSEEDFLNFLVETNKNLRGIYSDEDVICNGMIAGELTAPTELVRNNTLKELLHYVKNADNMNEIATLVYYSIIDLHMFSDGNGRTARFLYDLISNQIDGKNYIYYFHDENDNHYDGRENFEQFKGILYIDYLNYYANRNVKDELSSYLTQYPELNDKRIVCALGGFYGDMQKRIKDLFQANLTLDLSEKEMSDLAQILADNGTGQFTPSGIGLMIVANEKNELDKWIDINEKLINSIDKQNSLYSAVSNRMAFLIKRNIEGLSSWSSDDFRRVIEIGNWVKQKQFSTMIDMFANPQNYYYDTGIRMIDYIMNPEIINNNNKSL